MTLTYTFFISLGLIVILIAHKAFEIKRGRETFVSSLFVALDKPMRNLFDSGRNAMIERRERIMVFLRQDVPHHTLNMGEQFGFFLGGKYKNFLRKMRGIKSLEHGNGRSNFMRAMT